MFGKNDELDRIKEALEAVECDMSVFKSWQKQYDKVNRQWISVQDQYEKARLATRQVEADTRSMEKMLNGEEVEDRKEFARLLKNLKQRQNGFDHEFLISREDQEFHSTYDTILRLGVKALEVPADKIILQSEIENLLALLRENLEKEAPDPRHLCYYYLTGTDQALAKLPPAERLDRITRVYEHEFMEPILEMVELAIRRADEQRTLLLGKENRRSRKVLDAIAILLENTDGDQSVRERARHVVAPLVG